MQLVLKTAKLQEMVSRAVKGASNNKMVPLTSLMAIELAGGRLTLTTTDATNYLKVIDPGATGDDFYAVVKTDTFSKLIAKTTSESVTLTVKETNLEVKGNGTYVIELPPDEEGQLIRFPEYSFKEESPKSVIHLSTVKAVLSANKAAIAETMEAPCYTGYYFGDEYVLTTDTFRICRNAIKTLDRATLLPAELVSLLGLMTEEKITVQQDGRKILFSTPNCILYGVELDGITEFNVAAMNAFMDTEFPSNCKLPKQALLSTLERLSLFIAPYDNNGINLLFTAEGLRISSKQSTGSELIKYQGSEGFSAFQCLVDVNLFKSQVAAQDGEVVTLFYGHEAALKMTFGKITQIVALLMEEDESAGVEDTGVDDEPSDDDGE